MLPVTEFNGRRFDRFPSRDERRGNYLLEEVLPSQEPVIRTWSSRLTTDQGREGACVGHGHTTDAVASPRPAPRTATVEQANETALRLYHRAQQLDDWAGEAYEGTSVDAGFNAARELGWIDSWRWMTNVSQIRDAVIAEGPVVIGINWYDSMYETRPSGLVEVGGSIVGGHCLTIIGYHPGMRIPGEGWDTRFEVFKWKNSWGPDYGKNGVGYVRSNDLATLLNDHGDAAVAMGRHKVTL